MKRYFITGTGTDCGKTYVTILLLHYFKKSCAIKPVASGCLLFENKWVSDDAMKIAENSPLSLDVINPWRFRLAVSPHLAAKEEGVLLSARGVADYCVGLQIPDAERLFIEGAGGVMVPLNDHETWIDFLKISQIQVILVVGMTLGCINHALLTAMALKKNHIACVGWVANCLDQHMQRLNANLETLTKKLDFPLLAVFPFSGQIEDRSLQIL